MTTTPSQRARELLAEVIGDGMTADDLLYSDTSVCFVMEALAGIEAALRLPAGADWQPIETAPKDRTDILIAGGTYSVRDYPDLKFSGVGIAFWDRDHWHGNEDNAHDEWCRHQPTHWQPLPAATRHETGEG